MGTATTEYDRNNSSSTHRESRCKDGGGCVGNSTSGLGQADCSSQSTYNSNSDEIFRNGKATPDATNVDGDANDGRLKLSHSRDCAKCKGTGKIPALRNEEGRGYCTRCADAGFVKADAKLVLSIPAGVEKGQIEVYKGKGHVDLVGE